MTVIVKGRQKRMKRMRATGQGVMAQHTPQPLQGAPSDGFDGES